MASKKTPTRNRSNRSTGNTPRASTTTSGALMPVATPAVPSGRIGRSMDPAGLFTAPQALGADVSAELAGLAPTFGDVLRSIGTGVARSQTALDRGLVQTARALSDTNISVVTDVIQELDDDGLPVAAATELVQQEVSLINFVRPTVHEWSHVALSMDLSVGALDNESGVRFERTQSRDVVANVGLFFGFLGFGLASFRSSSSYSERNSDREQDWARGQVRMDAMLRPRPVEDLGAPAQVTIGPQIFFSQGGVTETSSGGVVTERSVELVVSVRKADGSPNPSVVLDVDSGPFLAAFDTTAGFTGNTTNADGQIRVTLTRNIPNPRFLRAARAVVTATLGELSQQTEVRL